jgi:hypothetical protein
MNKFFRDANFLVANITVRQNKANLFKANLLKVIWNVVIFARLVPVCTIAGIHLIYTMGDAIADGVMAL